MSLPLYPVNQVQNLEQQYQAFLKSMLDPKVGQDLAQELSHVGLDNESQALTAYCDRGSHVIPTLKWGVWGNRRCFVGTDLPLDADSGDLWFDVVELMPMLLIPPQIQASVDLREWISLHPVYNWQFKSFLKLADWHLIKEDFMTVTDLMDSNCRQLSNHISYVADVYHEESVAYSHWFGKQLAGQFALEKARAFTTAEQFQSLLPPDLRLWDGAECSSSEFVRVAVGQNTIDTDPDEEFELRESGQTISLEDRMVFEEWARRTDISFSTAVPLQLGLIQTLPRLGYEFLELHNAAFQR